MIFYIFEIKGYALGEITAGDVGKADTRTALAAWVKTRRRLRIKREAVFQWKRQDKQQRGIRACLTG